MKVSLRSVIENLSYQVSVDPTGGDIILAWKGSERHPPHVIHRVLTAGSWHHVVISYGTTPKQQRFGQRNGKVVNYTECYRFSCILTFYEISEFKNLFQIQKLSHLILNSTDSSIENLVQ